MSLTLAIYPKTVRTPGKCTLYGYDLDDITQVRVTAYRTGGQSGYLGIVAEAYVTGTTMEFSLTGKMFYDLGVGTDTTIELHFSGRLKRGAAAGRWTSLPLEADPEYVTVTAGDDCAPEIIGGSWTLVQPANYSLATSQPLAGLTSMEIECRVALYSVTGNPTVTGLLGGKPYSFAYVRDDGTWTKDGTAYPVKLYKATVGPLVAPQTDVVVTATEDGGLRSAEFTFSQNNVVNYEKPVLSIGALFRCTANYQMKDGGPYVEAYVTLNYDTKVTGNGVKKLTVKLNGTTYNLTSGQVSLIGGALSENRKYTAVIIGQDLAGSEVTREVILPGALKDFVVLRGSDNQGAHMGVGMTPAITTGKSSIELPLGGSFLLDDLEYGAYELLAGSPRFGTDFLNVDLLDAKAPQNATCYIAVNGSDWGTYTNGPSAVMNNNFSCLRKVIPCTRYTCIVILLETYPVRGRMWINIYSSGAFTGWKSLTPT